MLKTTSEGTAIIACSTCRLTHNASREEQGRTDGALLIAALRKAQASNPRYEAIAIDEMPCLFACGDSCTLHLRAPGKISYVLGRFTPDEAAAHAMLDYAVHYAHSEDGQVPYADWPEGVKGHFLTRSPPQGFTVE